MYSWFGKMWTGNNLKRLQLQFVEPWVGISSQILMTFSFLKKTKKQRIVQGEPCIFFGLTKIPLGSNQPVFPDNSYALKPWKGRSFENNIWVCVLAFLSVLHCWPQRTQHMKGLKWLSLMRLNRRELMLFKIYFAGGSCDKNLFLSKCFFNVIYILKILYPANTC